LDNIKYFTDESIKNHLENILTDFITKSKVYKENGIYYVDIINENKKIIRFYFYFNMEMQITSIKLKEIFKRNDC
jgi:hypothetical protein